MTLQVKQGLLEAGKRESVLTGKVFYYFSGIPYAEPPLNDLRFRPPKPLKQWSGVLKATTQKEQCIQMDFLGQTVSGSEDCLYLNVYIPELPRKDASLKAVMVYMHGGGFFTGTCAMDNAGPDYLMDYDVIVVAVTYRLHILGFLDMGIPSCPGNCGLKDQTLALQWVRENIRTFGGDPDNITIFGESAGGISANLHTLSPLSKGLFHKSIAQSGACIVPVPHRSDDPREFGFQAGRKLGFQGNDPEELVKYLKGQSAKDLCIVARAIQNELTKVGVPFPQLPFIQTIEKIRENAFLPDHPLELVKTTKQVPIIAGVCAKEGIAICPKTAKEMEQLNDTFNDLIKERVPCDESQLPQISAEVRKYYFGDEIIGWDTRSKLVNLLSDLFYLGLYDSLDFTENNKSPVYMYEFVFDGKLNASNLYAEKTNTPKVVDGPSHTDDIGYLLYPSHLLPEPKFEEPEKTVIRNVCSMWTNFAKTGNPTPDSSALGVEWKPSTTTTPTYLQIADNLTLNNEEIWNDRRAFWRSILQKIEK